MKTGTSTKADEANEDFTLKEMHKTLEALRRDSYRHMQTTVGHIQDLKMLLETFALNTTKPVKQDNISAMPQETVSTTIEDKVGGAALDSAANHTFDDHAGMAAQQNSMSGGSADFSMEEDVKKEAKIIHIKIRLRKSNQAKLVKS